MLYSVRVVTALKGDDSRMINEILTEIPDLADTYLEKPLFHMAAEYGRYILSS